MTLHIRGAWRRSQRGPSVLIVARDNKNREDRNLLQVLHGCGWGEETGCHFVGELQELQDRRELTVCKWTEVFQSCRCRTILSKPAMYRHVKAVCNSEGLRLQGKFTISDSEASSITIHISKYCLHISGLGILDNKYG